MPRNKKKKNQAFDDSDNDNWDKSGSEGEMQNSKDILEKSKGKKNKKNKKKTADFDASDDEPKDNKPLSKKELRKLKKLQKYQEQSPEPQSGDEVEEEVTNKNKNKSKKNKKNKKQNKDTPKESDDDRDGADEQQTHSKGAKEANKANLDASDDESEIVSKPMSKKERRKKQKKKQMSESPPPNFGDDSDNDGQQPIVSNKKSKKNKKKKKQKELSESPPPNFDESDTEEPQQTQTKGKKGKKNKNKNKGKKNQSNDKQIDEAQRLLNLKSNRQNSLMKFGNSLLTEIDGKYASYVTDEHRELWEAQILESVDFYEENYEETVENEELFQEKKSELESAWNDIFELIDQDYEEARAQRQEQQKEDERKKRIEEFQKQGLKIGVKRTHKANAGNQQRKKQHFAMKDLKARLAEMDRLALEQEKKAKSEKAEQKQSKVNMAEERKNESLSKENGAQSKGNGKVESMNEPETETESKKLSVKWDDLSSSDDEEATQTKVAQKKGKGKGGKGNKKNAANPNQNKKQPPKSKKKQKNMLADDSDSDDDDKSVKSSNMKSKKKKMQSPNVQTKGDPFASDEDETPKTKPKPKAKPSITAKETVDDSPTPTPTPNNQPTKPNLGNNDSKDNDDDEPQETPEDERDDQSKSKKKKKGKGKQKGKDKDKSKKTELRSPVCVVMGHVDTGKTKILDHIRSSSVQKHEVGGITQQIGATYLSIDYIKERTARLQEQVAKLKYKVPGLLFIDTPGHESFANLRSRGSSMCDIAVLVVDLMHGLEPQTIESLKMLQDRKAPFVVALNKIDVCYDWKPDKNAPFLTTFANQSKAAVNDFEHRLAKILVQFAENGVNAQIYTKNKRMDRDISLVPTSAITGEGIPDLLYLIVQLTKKYMESKISFDANKFKASVLEVKTTMGYGATIDVIVSNGTLRDDDTIVVCGMNGAIVTPIRALLLPHEAQEMRVKGEFRTVHEVAASVGVRIAAVEPLDSAVAGSPLFIVPRNLKPNKMAAKKREVTDKLKEEVQKSFADLFANVDRRGRGVFVQASTLGSLEALITFLVSQKIPISGIGIGTISKKTVMKAAVMLNFQKEYAVILAFNVKCAIDARQLAQEQGVKIFEAEIIYHLQEMFENYIKELREKRKSAAKDVAVFPVEFKIISAEHVFNNKNPLVLGVQISRGTLRLNTPICVQKYNSAGVATPVFLGRVDGIKSENKDVAIAKLGDKVSVRIQGDDSQKNLQVGRTFMWTDTLVSEITRESIDALKVNFEEEMKEDNDTVKHLVSLKKYFNII